MRLPNGDWVARAAETCSLRTEPPDPQEDTVEMDGTSAQFTPCVNRRRPPGRGMLKVRHEPTAASRSRSDTRPTFSMVPTRPAAGHRSWLVVPPTSTHAPLDAPLSLYAGGMTPRDIHHHLVSTIGTELSSVPAPRSGRSRRRFHDRVASSRSSILQNWAIVADAFGLVQRCRRRTGALHHLSR
jgi:hypothetical protein